MKIEVLYFEGCPSWRRALENLFEVLAEEGIEATVEQVPIASPEEAEVRGFLGSPTIRLNGVDLEGQEAANSGVGFGCRVYVDEEGRVSGWPSKAQIRAALRQVLTSSLGGEQAHAGR